MFRNSFSLSCFCAKKTKKVKEEETLNKSFSWVCWYLWVCLDSALTVIGDFPTVSSAKVIISFNQNGQIKSVSITVDGLFFSIFNSADSWDLIEIDNQGQQLQEDEVNQWQKGWWFTTWSVRVNLGNWSTTLWCLSPNYSSGATQWSTVYLKLLSTNAYTTLWRVFEATRGHISVESSTSNTRIFPWPPSGLPSFNQSAVLHGSSIIISTHTSPTWHSVKVVRWENVQDSDLSWILFFHSSHYSCHFSRQALSCLSKKLVRFRPFLRMSCPHCYFWVHTMNGLRKQTCSYSASRYGKQLSCTASPMWKVSKSIIYRLDRLNLEYQ